MSKSATDVRDTIHIIVADGRVVGLHEY